MSAGGVLSGALAFHPEVSGYLVGPPAFKAGGTGDPRPAGSIPVHLRRSGAASLVPKILA